MKERSANSSSASGSRTSSGGKERNAPSGAEAKSSASYDGLGSGAEVGVLLIDENRKIVTANDVSAAIFGTSELAGKEINALLKGGLQNEFGRVLQQKFQPGKGTQRFSFEVTALCKGGSSYPVSVILTRNSVSNKTWWTALFRKLEGDAKDQNQHEMLQGVTDVLQEHCLSMVEESTSYREELLSLQNERDELSGKLVGTQAAVGDLEKKLADAINRYQKLEISHLETKKELENLQNGTAVKEKDIENEIAQNERLKEELVALRQMCDDLTDKLASEQLSSVDGSRRVVELEQQVKTSNEAESRIQASLAEANQEVDRLKAERTEEDKKSRDMAEELDGLRLTLQELEGKRVVDQQAVEKAAQRQQELEAEVQAKTEEWEKARNELSHLDLPGSQEEWMQDLRRLREAEASFETDRADLEHRVREGITALARATADLERERKERRRIEQRSASLTSQLQEMHEELRRHLESERSTQDRIIELEERSREQEAAVTRLQGELREEVAGRQLAEEQLNLGGDMKSQVDNYRTLFEESKETFKRSREDLEAKLQTTLQSLNDAESKLRQEINQRQRLQESLGFLQEQHDRGALQLSKLQSELQVERLERKQMEGDAAHSRYATLDSARVNRAQTSTLKRQLRQPVDSLMQSTRSLLEADLPEQQRAMVETLLENTLLVQACLQEGGTAPGTTTASVVDTNESPVNPTSPEAEDASGDVHQAA